MIDLDLKLIAADSLVRTVTTVFEAPLRRAHIAAGLQQRVKALRGNLAVRKISE